MFIRETTANPFLSIFMARRRENEQQKYGKSEELPSGVGLSQQTSKYADDEEHRIYCGILFCFGLKEGLVD